MWDMKACLACLSTNKKMERISEPLQKLYLSLLGIKISDIDGYPTYFCYICQAQMRKLLSFKRKCRRAYYVIKEIVSVKKKLTLLDIRKVNRGKTNLKSPIGYWKTLNTAVYSLELVESPSISLDTLDLCGPGEWNPKLIKKELCTTGRVWNIEIKSSFNIEPESEVMSTVQKKIPVVETDNGNVVPSQDIENGIPKHVTSDLAEGVNNDVAIDDDDNNDYVPDFEFPLPKRKTKGTPAEIEFGSKILRKSLTQVGKALAHAEIRCLSKLEQIAMYNELKNCYAFQMAPFKCGLCLIVFESMKDLTYHIKRHNKLFSSSDVCDVCKVKSWDKVTLKTHMAEKHAYLYTCKLCRNSARTTERSFNVLDSYITHFETTHQEQSEIDKRSRFDKMEFLGQNFEIHSVDQLTMYAKLTDPECQYICSECDMRFLDHATYKSHVNRHRIHERTKKPVQCDICGTFFKNLTQLSSHVEDWHLFTFKCKTCSEVAFNKPEAVHHACVKHLRINEITCEFCGKSYSCELKLITHKKLSHYTQTYQFHCFVCGDSFYSIAHLYKHQLRNYKRIRIFDPTLMEDGHRCDQCNVTFLSLKSYQIHAIKHEHEVAKSFENACLFCKMLFDTAEEYVSHTGTKCKAYYAYPRKCFYCDLMMSSFEKYRTHHRSKHPLLPLGKAIRSTLCELCGEAVVDRLQHEKEHAEDERLDCMFCSPTLRFPDMWKYTVHMLSVHTPKPFVCDLCSQSFEMRKQCKEHIMKEHGEFSPYKCDTCSETFINLKALLKHCNKYRHTTHVKMERKPCRSFYVYPHMRIDVTMFKPKLLSRLRLYLCDFMNTSRTLLSDINDYIYFVNQDQVPPVVSERLKLEKRNSAGRTGIEYAHSLNEPMLETVQNGSYSRMASKELMHNNKRSKKKMTIFSNQLNGSKIEGIKENCESLQELSCRYPEGSMRIFKPESLQENTLPVKNKKKLKPERPLLENSAVKYGTYGQDISVIKEGGCESSQGNSPTVEYKNVSKVKEEVIEETPMEYEYSEQGFSTIKGGSCESSQGMTSEAECETVSRVDEELIEETVVEYENYEQSFSPIKEGYETSHEQSLQVECESESKVEEEVVEETGVHYNQQNFKIFQENGKKYIIVNGVIYKLAEGYAFSEIQR